MAFFQDNLGKPAPERQTILDFTEARHDGVAVASAGPYANHLHHTPDRQPHQYPITQFFTGRMLFLTPNQHVVFVSYNTLQIQCVALAVPEIIAIGVMVGVVNPNLGEEEVIGGHRPRFAL